MKHIFRRKIKGRRNFAKSCSFRFSLFFHQFITGKPQLNARKGMDAVAAVYIYGIQSIIKPLPHRNKGYVSILDKAIDVG